jgi:hypothetical protein
VLVESLGHDNDLHFLESLVSSHALIKEHIFSRTKLDMNPRHFIVHSVQPLPCHCPYYSLPSAPSEPFRPLGAFFATSAVHYATRLMLEVSIAGATSTCDSGIGCESSTYELGICDFPMYDLAKTVTHRVLHMMHRP